MVDQPVSAFAGLWNRAMKADGTGVESCVHITTPASALIREIHYTGSNAHRMSASLRKQDRDIWLN